MVLPAIVFVAHSLYCTTVEEPAQAPEPTQKPVLLRAVAEMNPTEGSTVSGTVVFEQVHEEVTIKADLSGLSPGKHGFHVHEVGDCSAPDGTSTGGHFNPFNVKHGSPAAPEHHVGDLGNIDADEEGDAHFELTVDYMSLRDGMTLVLGRAVIVHAQEDDLDSRFVGNAGLRVACGVIEGLVSG